MQLDSIAANVRMRSPWEAIDLGFAMVRTWWLIIYPPPRDTPSHLNRFVFASHTL